ncbi:hypothetical protein AAMO2058_001568200 [Amorphochlora amoebiformis]|uniref:Ribosomal protein L1 n=1 Tax=Amorphochlora amoebiformis TaxID=1561963 RepID=A0A7S0CUF9_9EUKA
MTTSPWSLMILVATLELGRGERGQIVCSDFGCLNEFRDKPKRTDRTAMLQRRNSFLEHDMNTSERILHMPLLERAVKSLSHHLKNRQGQKKGTRRSLAGASEGVHLVVALRKLRDFRTKTKPKYITLPHPLNPLEINACLIVKERKTPVGGKGFHKRKALAEQKNITIITLRTIRQQHTISYFEKLLSRHRVFFCDKRIVQALARVLGPKYYHRFSPTPVSLLGKDWQYQCQQASSLTTMRMQRSASLTAKVGRLGMPEMAIVRNVLAACNSAVRQLFPGKRWASIKAMYLRTDESIAIPIFHRDPDVLAPIMTRFEEKKAEEGKIIGVQTERRDIGGLGGKGGKTSGLEGEGGNVVEV